MIRLGLGLALAAAVVWSQTRIDREERFRPQQDVLYLGNGAEVRRLVPGFEGLMADVYWLRVVQYYGYQHIFAAEPRFDLLAPLAEITTALDPHLIVAYQYGGIFLSEAYPTGAGQPQAAVRLLERGVRENPGNWQLRQSLALIHHFFLNDSRTAARILDEAADLPGAPAWLRSLAADLLTRVGDRNVSRQLWQRLYEQGEEWIRLNALYRLRRLDALDIADALGAQATLFQKARGRYPASAGELAEFLGRPLPPDPTGVALAYDPQQGRFAIARESSLYRQGSLEGE